MLRIQAFLHGWILLLCGCSVRTSKAPAVVRVFRNCGQKGDVRYFSACLLLGRCSNPAAQLRKNCGIPGYSIRVSCTCFLRCRRARDLFFMDSKGDVRQFFWLVFRKPLARILLLFEAFASGFPRPDFEMISERVQTSIYLAIVFSVRVSCDVGGLEACFLWIPKVTFGSFSGLCFASLWHGSCCCLRLSQAVFQGQISRWFRSESRRAFTWL